MNKKTSRSKTNIFMDIIYKYTMSGNVFKKVFYKCKINSFKRKIRKCSPDFWLLWNMADFIKYAEEVFMYNNSLDNNCPGLFSSRGYIDGQNGFKISGIDYTMVIKLFSDTKKVAINIDRLNGGNIKTSLLFKNEEWDKDPTIYEEILLEGIIRDMNERFINLFDYCLNKY